MALYDFLRKFKIDPTEMTTSIKINKIMTKSGKTWEKLSLNTHKSNILMIISSYKRKGEKK